MSGAGVSSTRSLIPISWCFVFGNNTKKWRRNVVCYTEQCSKCVMLNCGIKLVKPGIQDAFTVSFGGSTVSHLNVLPHSILVHLA